MNSVQQMSKVETHINALVKALDVKDDNGKYLSVKIYHNGNPLFSSKFGTNTHNENDMIRYINHHCKQENLYETDAVQEVINQLIVALFNGNKTEYGLRIQYRHPKVSSWIDMYGKRGDVDVNLYNELCKPMIMDNIHTSKIGLIPQDVEEADNEDIYMEDDEDDNEYYIDPN